MLTDAGFIEARVHGWTGYRTSSCTYAGALVSDGEPPRSRRKQSGWPTGPRS
ncbi:MAG: hypothetical protein WKF75_20175 [Singulisphaera sp.]